GTGWVKIFVKVFSWQVIGLLGRNTRIININIEMFSRSVEIDPRSFGNRFIQKCLLVTGRKAGYCFRKGTCLRNK
ncbi:MAG TPA: hypothetical protein DDW50_01955, partial [Firmicutes bacterium]|nr:hypothetical protein [Bacillota bacterium]